MFYAPCTPRISSLNLGGAPPTRVEGEGGGVASTWRGHAEIYFFSLLVFPLSCADTRYSGPSFPQAPLRGARRCQPGLAGLNKHFSPAERNLPPLMYSVSFSLAFSFPSWKPPPLQRVLCTQGIKNTTVASCAAPFDLGARLTTPT